VVFQSSRAGAEEGLLKVTARQLVLVERPYDDVLFEVVPELGCGEVAQDVVVLVDRGEGDMQLCGPVGLPFAAGWALDELYTFHEVPPQVVQVLAVGIFVEGLLIAVHDQSPAGEDEAVVPAAPSELSEVGSDLLLGDAGDGGEPTGVVG
jgi:hypothetical protein